MIRHHPVDIGVIVATVHSPPSLAGSIFYVGFGVALLAYVIYAIATGVVIAGRFSVSHRRRQPFGFWTSILFWGVFGISFLLTGLSGVIYHSAHSVPAH